MLLGKVNTTAIVQWSLRERGDPTVSLSGQAANYVVSIWKDGVISAVTGTVAEVGSTGVYKATFTPTSEGLWEIECVNVAIVDVVCATVSVYSATLSDLDTGIETINTGVTNVTSISSDIRANTDTTFKQAGKFDERARQPWTKRGTSTSRK